MTTDDVLGRDLAALAREDRDSVPPLDRLFSAIEPPQRAPGLAVLAVARVYADRVGWIAGGATVLVASVVLLVACADRAFASLWDEFHLLGRLIHVVTDRVALDVLGLACVTGLLARRIGELRFARGLARGRDAGELVDRVDPWAVAAKITALTLIVQLWGSLQIAAYCGSLWPVFDPGVWYALAAALPVAIAAIAIARGARRDARWVRVLSHRVVPLVAFLVFAGAFDAHWQLMNDDHELPLAIDLATRVVATLALLAASSWYALRVRRSDEQAVKPGQPPP